MDKVGFINDIAKVINKHSAENESNTPDFILAEYLLHCLESFDCAVSHRERWYGRAKDEENLEEINEALK